MKMKRVVYISQQFSVAYMLIHEFLYGSDLVCNRSDEFSHLFPRGKMGTLLNSSMGKNGSRIWRATATPDNSKAYLSRPDLLILDELTSAMDEETENKNYEFLDKFRRYNYRSCNT